MLLLQLFRTDGHISTYHLAVCPRQRLERNWGIPLVYTEFFAFWIILRCSQDVTIQEIDSPPVALSINLVG